MKKLLVVLFLVSVVGLSYGQLINEKQDGVTVHKKFQVYTKSSYTGSTATDTTAFLNIGEVGKLAVSYTVNDTIKGSVYYQFKNSFTGYTNLFAKCSDSLSAIGTSSALQSDRIHAFISGNDTSTVWYDQVRFYIDYTTYLGVAYTGGTLKLYVDIYKP